MTASGTEILIVIFMGKSSYTGETKEGFSNFFQGSPDFMEGQGVRECGEALI